MNRGFTRIPHKTLSRASPETGQPEGTSCKRLKFQLAAAAGAASRLVALRTSVQLLGGLGCRDSG